MNLNKMLHDADQAMEAGRYKVAIRTFDKVYDVLDLHHPLPNFDKARILMRRALAQARSGQAAEVLETLEWAHEYLSTWAGADYEDALWARAILAEARMLSGDPDGARAEAQATLDVAVKSK